VAAPVNLKLCIQRQRISFEALKASDFASSFDRRIRLDGDFFYRLATDAPACQ
jgi:hypothetical protein